MHQRSQVSARTASRGSWIDVASQPSSSSLSSTTEDTSNPQSYVQSSGVVPLRRRVTPDRGFPLELSEELVSTSESSQEEDEESESESDQLLTSSVEDAESLPINERERQIDTNTALNSMRCFTPQPNAFSHPPSSSYQSRDFVTNSYFPSSLDPPRSNPSQLPSKSQRQSHCLLSIISPGYQAEHDAALRASLNTLLSCAAAARGLPKIGRTDVLRCQQYNAARVQPSSLRIVPETIYLGQYSNVSEHSSTSTGSHECNIDAENTHERKVTRSSSKETRTIKRVSKTGRDNTPAPTLFTWVISAGVLVLVSAISFSAGFAIGRESICCDKEPIWDTGSKVAKGCRLETFKPELGLRKLKWAGAASVVRV